MHFREVTYRNVREGGLEEERERVSKRESKREKEREETETDRVIFKKFSQLLSI